MPAGLRIYQAMRSDLLVHWTGGKNISEGITDPETLCSIQMASYIERLASILSSGLWMSCPTELIHGAGDSNVGFRTPTVCFTEIKLSQALQHAKCYGFLGIAVQRRFVLERLGGPVHYVRNHSHEKFIESYAQIGAHIQSPTVSTQKIFDAIAYCASFLKPMSVHETDDFSLLDEHEWRIVFTPELLTDKLSAETSTGRYSIPIPVDEVKLVIFPNDDTRSLWMSRSERATFERSRKQPPIYLTIKECSQF